MKQMYLTKNVRAKKHRLTVVSPEFTVDIVSLGFVGPISWQLGTLACVFLPFMLRAD